MTMCIIDTAAGRQLFVNGQVFAHVGRAAFDHGCDLGILKSCGPFSPGTYWGDLRNLPSDFPSEGQFKSAGPIP